MRKRENQMIETRFEKISGYDPDPIATPNTNKNPLKKLQKSPKKNSNFPHFFPLNKYKNTSKKYKNGPTVFLLKNTKKTPNIKKKTHTLQKEPISVLLSFLGLFFIFWVFFCIFLGKKVVEFLYI
jgi:hypothetical protein